MTRRISLRKALQLKKTLTGEIAKLTATVQKFNAQKKLNPHVNVPELVEQIRAKVQNLIELKTALAKANVGIYESIITVDEMKGRISFYEGLPVEETIRDYQDGKSVEVAAILAINYGQREAAIKEAQATLDAALEKIDEYNSTNYIEISF